MKSPPGLSIMIRVPSRSDKKQTRQKAGLFFGAPAGTRTPDTLLKRQVLYRLSYWGMSSEHALLGFGFAKGLERHPPNRNPAKRFRFGKEEGTYGYGAFPALTETGEAEWSKFLLTWWLGWRDSNPLYRSQSPVCYHYTTSHCRRKPGPAPPASASWWGGIWGSNPRHPEPQSGALPTELIPPYLSAQIPARPIQTQGQGPEVVFLSRSPFGEAILKPRAAQRRLVMASLAKHKAQRSGFVFERKEELTDMELSRLLRKPGKRNGVSFS